MTSRVAIIEFNGDNRKAVKQALDMIGGIDDLNTARKSVVVKVGVFSHKAENHTSVGLVDAITYCFNEAPKIFLAESDNYKGTGSERLQIWKELFTERVVPINLSGESDTRRVRLVGQEMKLPSILFKPNVFVDTHILRSFERGSILKNLFGCILDSKRIKYHNILPTLLADVYEAVGAIDLAVLDGTYFWQGAGDAPIRMNILIVGRDAVAVETIGAVLAGLDPKQMSVIQEFVKRRLGEGDLKNIEIVGTPIESLKEKFKSARMTQKKLHSHPKGPQTWGGQAHDVFESLVREGFFKLPKRRTTKDVATALEARGLSTKGNENKIVNSLTRRASKGILKKAKTSDGWIYWTE